MMVQYRVNCCFFSYKKSDFFPMQFAIKICFFYEKLTNTPLTKGQPAETLHPQKDRDIINYLK